MSAKAIRERILEIVSHEGMTPIAAVVNDVVNKERVTTAEGYWKWLPTTTEVDVTITLTATSRDAALELFPEVVSKMDREVETLRAMDWVKIRNE